jgi:hypothetical protein|tara:strand:- start:100 stop:285 length:186 start_codon:yes stop_codon:yes gene_type:complete
MKTETQLKKIWEKRFEPWTQSPEKEKVLNQHLRLVVSENPGSRKFDLYEKLYESLTERTIN